MSTFGDFSEYSGQQDGLFHFSALQVGCVCFTTAHINL